VRFSCAATTSPHPNIRPLGLTTRLIASQSSNLFLRLVWLFLPLLPVSPVVHDPSVCDRRGHSHLFNMTLMLLLLHKYGYVSCSGRVACRADEVGHTGQDADSASSVVIQPSRLLTHVFSPQDRPNAILLPHSIFNSSSPGLPPSGMRQRLPTAWTTQSADRIIPTAPYALSELRGKTDLLASTTEALAAATLEGFASVQGRTDAAKTAELKRRMTYETPLTPSTPPTTTTPEPFASSRNPRRRL
jgi:hypothetical protein